MAGFLYYIPHGSRSAGQTEIDLLGLGYVLGGASLTVCGVSRGPDGDEGVVLSNGDRMAAQSTGYYPTRQGWRERPDKKVWVGWMLDDRPKPDDLAVSDPLLGRWITLGDDQLWLVPVARGLTAEEGELICYQALPESIGLDGSGRWVRGGVLERYQWLWDIAEAWWSVRRQEACGKRADPELIRRFDLDGQVGTATQALATNYRIGPVESWILGLWTDRTVKAVLDCLIDWDFAVEWLKKKVMATPGGSPGDDGPKA